MEASELGRLISASADERDGSSADSDRGLGGLSIVIRETGTTFEILASGEWDVVQRRAVHDAMQSVLARDPECIVLDLSGLSFIDSNGIHNILELRDRCVRAKVHLVIIPGCRSVQRPFEVCGLIDSLPFVGSKA